MMKNQIVVDAITYMAHNKYAISVVENMGGKITTVMNKIKKCKMCKKLKECRKVVVNGDKQYYCHSCFTKYKHIILS